jgi:general stress protein 26
MSKEKVLEIIKASPTAFMATVDGKSPRVRPMALDAIWGNKIYGSTFSLSDKVQQLTRNDVAEIAWMDPQCRHVRIRAKVSCCKNQELKKKYYEEKAQHLKDYFSGPNDPNYTLLEIVPFHVDLMDTNDKGYRNIKW